MSHADPPSRDEIERIRKLYADFEDTPDQLTQAALVVSVPRLLARTGWKLAKLAKAVRA